jgi:hypothetical protein
MGMGTVWVWVCVDMAGDGSIGKGQGYNYLVDRGVRGEGDETGDGEWMYRASQQRTGRAGMGIE